MAGQLEGAFLRAHEKQCQRWLWMAFHTPCVGTRQQVDVFVRPEPPTYISDRMPSGRPARAAAA